MTKRLLTAALAAAMAQLPVAVSDLFTPPAPTINKKDSFANQRLRDKQRKMERKARRR